MSGKRLVDAARLVNATRSIARQHVQLRSQQLDVYNKTSTLAKAVKSQSDRVTLTAQAALALLKRMNEQVPKYDYAAQYSSQQKEKPRPRPTTRTDSIQEIYDTETKRRTVFDGQNGRQPHHEYERTDAGNQPQAASSNQIQIPAVTASAGSPGAQKLNQDVFYEPSEITDQVGPSSAKARIPKHVENQQSAGSIDTAGINADTFYEHGGARSEVEQSQIPEGVDLNVFRTDKVSRMLGVEPKKDTRRAPDPQPQLSPVFGMKAENGERPSRTPMEQFAAQLAQDAEQNSRQPLQGEALPSAERTTHRLRESRVPASRLGRLWEYAGLGTSLALGAVGEGLRRVTGSNAGGSLILSPANMERLVAKLSHMRGAALKLGQMISFQDLKLLPAPIHDVLQRVQDSADYMPTSQRDKVLAANLGSDWRSLFSEFEDVPIAAASIGQVHKAVMASTGMEVAVKVQYPGVAKSISSDLSNLSVLLTASRLLPKGLYLDKTIANARTELAWECDYIREAECAKRFRELLSDEPETFTVPLIVDEACGREVLTAELMHGVAVTKIRNLTQEQRDWVGTQILRLALREICEFRFMQTDPNWTNFLFNAQTHKLELLDFGASRDFPLEFVEPYVGILKASAVNDRDTIRDLSIQLGYLTGEESRTMLDAHIDSVLTLAEPFQEDGPEIYDFRNQTITDRVRSLIPTMVRERLAPPPEETYSLHRKLSGAFLLCARLGSRVPCKQLFSDAMQKLKRIA